MDLGDPEHGHDGVADVLLHAATVSLEDGTHPVEVRGHHPAEDLGVEALAERGGPHHVGEGDRDDLPRPHGRRVAKSAAAARPGGGSSRGAAPGGGPGRRGPGPAAGPPPTGRPVGPGDGEGWSWWTCAAPPG